MPVPAIALERLLVALLVGFLIGLDRERAEVRKAIQMFAGVRTFPLIALAGAVPTMMIDEVGAFLLVASFLGVAAIAWTAYLRGSAAGEVGATTEIAALVTFFLGVLAGAGQLLVCSATGIAVAVLLVAKPRLEGFSRALSQEELSSALELAVISGIVLPLLPNRGYGPWEVLNPFEIWLVVVVVSALSFVGFVAMRILGSQRGITVAAVVGALVSSTMVTVSMATRAREDGRLADAAASGAVLASAIMSLRVALLTGAIAPGILVRLLPVVISTTAVGLLAAWWIRRRSEDVAAQAVQAVIRNPFSVTSALTFGALFGLILLGVRAAQSYFGDAGLYVAAALSAVADVDAISVALVHAGPAHDGWRGPAAAVTIAMLVNTLVKLGIAVVMGAGSFRPKVAISLLLMCIAGGLTGAAVFVWY